MFISLSDPSAPSISYLVVDMADVEEEDISEIDPTPTPGPSMDITGTGIAMPWEAFTFDVGPTGDVVSMALSTAEMKDLQIPMTGESQSGLVNSVLLTNQMENMGLSVVNEQNLSLGYAYDFLVDRETGDIMYAVLVNEETTGNHVFTVPMSQFTWQLSELQDDASQLSLGSLIASFDIESLTDAPGFDSLSEFDFSRDLQELFQDYWDNIGSMDQ